MEKITTKKYVLKRAAEIKPEYKIDYEKDLNAAQLKAAEHKNGPLLIIAGAGSGKTRTLVYKVARLIEEGIRPENILLLTFTRRAAKEMISRVERLLCNDFKKITGGTFHSFANMILRKYSQLLELKNNFTVIDRSDAEDIINHVRGKLIDKKEKRFPKKGTITDIYSKTINKDINVEEIVKSEFSRFEDCTEKIIEIITEYNKYKREHSLLDYDDLLLYLKTLLLSNSAVRKKISERYKHILVDEYQDTNSLQSQIVQLIAGEHGNVTAVGDDSQSIYSFRGANFKNILEFPNIYQNCEVIKLERNYRSSENILALANEVLNKAKEKYSKKLYSDIVHPEKPALVKAYDTRAEAEFTIQKITELTEEENISLNEIAILSRSSSMTYDIETELIKKKIPYKKIGGLKFTETAHVKDITAYLRVVLNPADEISFGRILHLAKGIGTSTINKILPVLTETDTPKLPDLKKAQNEELVYLLKIISEARQHSSEPDIATEIILKYYEPRFSDKYDDADKRRKDLEHILYLSTKYRNLEDFVSDIVLEPPEISVTEAEKGSVPDECLTVSTIHGAKGTEYRAVFIIGATDGKFPSIYSFNSEEELDEELRLFYVAITRAKTYLYISYPTDLFDRATGTVLSKPSIFTDNIPDDILEKWVVTESE